jgi:hypothetical protein
VGKSERSAETVRPFISVHCTKQSVVSGPDELGCGYIPSTLSTENINNSHVQRLNAGAAVLVDEVGIPRRSDSRRGGGANVWKF